MVSEQFNESSVGCRSNWGCSLKQIMRTRNAPAASCSKQAKNKKRKTKAAVVEDAEDGDDYNFDGFISGGADDSEDADYVEEEEDFAEDDIDVGDYEVESEYVVTHHTDKKRKVVPPLKPLSRPPPQTQQRFVRRAQRPVVHEEEDDVELFVGQPGLTLGEKVIKNGVIVATQLRNCSWKPANFNCRVGAFADVVKALKVDENKIKLVEESGFGGLLKLQVRKIDRRFCYWLMARIDPDKKVVTGGDGRELPLCPEQWRCIFGLPRGPNNVPVKVQNAAMQARVDRIVQHYGETTKDGVCHIKIQQAVDELPLMPIVTDHEKDEFMKAFLLVMLGLLICPTTNGQSMATALLPAVSTGAAAGDFDWCSCAHSWLMTCVRDFRKRLHSKGYAAGGGGCVLFLQIFYLDHIALPPLSWGRMPRVEVWTEKKLSAAILADSLPSLDYGKLKTVDVAYGERHPLVGRDSTQPLEVRIANEVLEMIKPMFENMEKRLKEACNSRPMSRTAPKERSAVLRSPVPSQKDVTTGSTSSIKERELESPNMNMNSLDETFRKLEDVVDVGNTQMRVSEVIQDVTSKVLGEIGGVGPELSPKGKEGDKSGEGKKAKGESGEEGLGNEASQMQSHESDASHISEEAEGGEQKRNRSGRKRALKPSSKVISGDYVGNRRARVSKLKTADLNLVKWIRLWSSASGSGPTLLECEGEFANRECCYNVLHCRRRVGTEYVAVASKLYTNEWGIKFQGHSKRIMLHPAFAIKLVTDMDDAPTLAKKHGHPLRGVPCSQLSVIFVPVLMDEHWWCAAFSFKEQKIWLIDSMYSNPAEQHDAFIRKLVSAMEVLINTHDKRWEDTFRSWPVESVEVVHQPDIVSCGVIMLSCIRASTNRFQKKYQMEGGGDPQDMEFGRAHLVIEDLRSVCNERRDELDNLVVL